MFRIALPVLLVFTAALTACGPTPDEQYQTARTKVADGQYTEAISLLNEVLEEQPDRAEAYNLRGVAYMEMDSLSNAISEFTQAIRVTPEDYRPYFNRANTYRVQQKLPEALQDYNIVISKEPALTDAYLNRSVVLFEMKNLKAASKDIKEALQLAPENKLVLLNAGKIFYTADSLNLAENSLKKLVNQDNQNGEAFYLLGQVKRKQSNSGEACTLFKQAIKYGYTKAEALAKLSCASVAE